MTAGENINYSKLGKMQNSQKDPKTAKNGIGNDLFAPRFPCLNPV